MSIPLTTDPVRKKTRAAKKSSMSKLGWMKDYKGGFYPQKWMGPDYVGTAEFGQKGTNEDGQPIFGILHDRVVKSYELSSGEDELSLNELAKRYPPPPRQ